MSKPESLKIEPWTEFPKQAYSIFNDDFAHEKPLVTKITAKNDRTTINFKETLTNNSGKWAISDQTKLWFYLPGSQNSIYAKLRSNNYVKLHYDSGITLIKNKQHNFYGSLNTNKSFDHVCLKLGVHHISDSFSSDNRIKVSKQGSAFQNYFYSRTMVYRGKWTFGLLEVFDISQKVIQKNDIMIGYKHNDKHSFFGRAQVAEFRKRSLQFGKPDTYFDKLTFDYIASLNDKSKIGLQVQYDVRRKGLKEVTLVGQTYIPESKTKLKGRINNNMDVALSFVRPLPRFEDLVKVTASISAKNLIGDDRSFRHGVQLDINI